MHRMCDFFVPRDRCKPHTRGTRIGNICCPRASHVVHGLHRQNRHDNLHHEWTHLRTWYTDCILIFFDQLYVIANSNLRTWYTDCVGKHAQILLHIYRRFYLIVLILADVR